LGDPYWAPPPARPFIAEVGAPAAKLRIAFSTRTITGAEISPQCVAAVEDAARLCAHLGHEVVEAMPKIDAERFFLAFTSVLSAGFTWAIDDWARRLGRTPTEDLFEPFVWSFTGRGRQITAPQYLLAVQDLQRISRTVALFFVDHDVWLTPMLGEPPVPLGTFAYQSGTDPFELRRKMARFTPFSYFANATGQPAMVVPTYWTAEGLPIGNQYIGRFGDEATLFRLASQIEAERPWTRRHPPVWAA
jgi:amidase